jgi:hypothetical protein
MTPAPDLPVTSNGETPKGEAKTLRFTEDLRFGADEEEDHYQWVMGATDIAVDNKGNIYVADVRESRLLVFDAEGRFQRVAVPKGQGPGEMVSLASFQVLADGRGVAYEGRPGILPKLHFFAPDMSFQHQKAPGGFSKILIYADFSPDGSMMGTQYLAMSMEDGNMFARTALMDLDFNPLREFSAHEQTMDFQRFNEPGVLRDFIATLLKNALAGVGVFAFGEDGSIYTALSSEYEITRWNKELEKQHIFEKTYKPVAYRDEEIAAITDRVCEAFRGVPQWAEMINDAFVKRVIEIADITVPKNPVNGMIAMPDGHLLVVHLTDEISGEQTADIFDQSGYLIGQVTMGDWAFLSPLGQVSMVFKNGFAYTLEIDEDEFVRAVRYRYGLEPAS